ncbi:MAG: zinc ribbon domain-containing protein, partial [Lachnospiraceae bacterium]|nr:zinc ribbon domain-containing protein [Lachnospiraceae bacterium]
MANCTNCGTLVEEGALFCRNCGAKLEAPPVAAPAMEAPVMAPMQGAPMTGMPAEPKRKKKFPVVLVSVIASVLVIAIVVVVILLTRRTEVSINSFISLEYSGYDTLGTAEIVFDSDAFEEKYGDKIKYMSGKEDEYLDAIDFLEDELEDSAYLEKDSDLTNGDVVKFTWDIDKEYIE